MTALEALVRPDVYPRASAYDPGWLVGLSMGPHPLWLLEDLSRDLDLRPGMRVLDLGSGRGATSVFLAREFGVEVYAADLWVPAETAEAEFVAAGVEQQVHAVHAEAHALPFEDDYFDAIVCIDAYEYFGTDDMYLGYLVRFLRPGGQLAIATPAMTKEIRDLGYIPRHIKDLVGWEALAWHTPEWWRFQWDITELVTVTAARLQDSGWQDWLLWAKVCLEHGDPAEADMVRQTIDLLEADQGEYLSFAMVTARANAAAP